MSANFSDTPNQNGLATPVLDCRSLRLWVHADARIECTFFTLSHSNSNHSANLPVGPEGIWPLIAKAVRHTKISVYSKIARFAIMAKLAVDLFQIITRLRYWERYERSTIAPYRSRMKCLKHYVYFSPAQQLNFEKFTSSSQQKIRLVIMQSPPAKAAMVPCPSVTPWIVANMSSNYLYKK